MSVKSELKNFFTDHWKYMAVSAACKLNLFDEVKQGFNPGEIAEKNQWDLKQLTILFDALSEIKFLIKTENGFQLNERSELLTEGHEDSLKYACLNWSDEHLTSWQNLDFSIRTGQSSFEEFFKVTFFEYLKKKPQKLDSYHKAMQEYAKDDYQELTNLIDFSRHKSVMDVGGGYGVILKRIKNKNTNVQCLLFDLKAVVDKVKIPSIKIIGGDFFKEIPKVAESIILSRVIHDWNDMHASIILKNCYSALPKKGTLYLIENFADEISDISFLSLSMTVICESFERSKSEYINLLTCHKFKITEINKLNNLQYIITAIK